MVEGWMGAPWGLFYKDTNLIHRVSTLMTSVPPNHHTYQPSHGSLGSQHIKFGATQTFSAIGQIESSWSYQIHPQLWKLSLKSLWSIIFIYMLAFLFSWPCYFFLSNKRSNPCSRFLGYRNKIFEPDSLNLNRTDFHEHSFIKAWIFCTDHPVILRPEHLDFIAFCGVSSHKHLIIKRGWQCRSD